MIIDRFEGEFAVCELDSGEMMNVLKNLLPKGAKENSVIKEKNGIYYLDLEEEEKRKERIRKLEDCLFE